VQAVENEMRVHLSTQGLHFHFRGSMFQFRKKILVLKTFVPALEPDIYQRQNAHEYNHDQKNSGYVSDQPFFGQYGFLLLLLVLENQVLKLLYIGLTEYGIPGGDI